MKKLKIQFWKAEKALAMQILEQEGSFRDSEYVGTGYPELCCDRIYLCDEEERGNLGVAARHFDTNASRDEYLKTVIRWISEEQFGKNNEEMLKAGDLKIGEMCEVRNSESGNWRKRKLIAILPRQYDERFITELDDYSTGHCSWYYARPITKRTEPTVEECGQLITYTWEEK